MHQIILLLLSLRLLQSTGDIRLQQEKINDSNSIFNSKLNSSNTVILDSIIGDTLTIEKSLLETPNVKLIIQNNESADYLKYIVPIFTLLLGIGLNKALDWFSDRKKINTVGQRWIAELRSLEIPLKKQIEILKKFLIEHKKEKLDTPTLEMFTILNGEIFKSLDKSEFVKYLSLLNKNRYDNAVSISNKVNGFITILISHYERLTSKFEEYLNGISKYSSSLSRNLGSLMISIRNYGVELEIELNSDPANDPRYKPITDLYDKQIAPFLSRGNFEIYTLERDFFLPMLEVLAALRRDKRINDMANSVSNCLSDIRALKMEKAYLTENLETLINRYEKDLIELPKLLMEIS